MCPGEFTFEDKKAHERPSAIDEDELKTLVEANFCTIIQELDVFTGKILNIWTKLEKQRILKNGYHTNWTKTRKNDALLRNNNDQFLHDIMICVEQPTPFSTVIGLRWSSWTIPKVKVTQLKIIVAVWWSALRLIH